VTGLLVEAFSDHDTVRLLGSLLRQNIVAVIADAARDVTNGIAVVEVDQEQLPGRHGFEFQLGLDEIIGANHPAKIQLFIRMQEIQRDFRHRDSLRMVIADD